MRLLSYLFQLSPHCRCYYCSNSSLADLPGRVNDFCRSWLAAPFQLRYSLVFRRQWSKWGKNVAQIHTASYRNSFCQTVAQKSGFTFIITAAPRMTIGPWLLSGLFFSFFEILSHLSFSSLLRTVVILSMPWLFFLDWLLSAFGNDQRCLFRPFSYYCAEIRQKITKFFRLRRESMLVLYSSPPLLKFFGTPLTAPDEWY